jgi:two-component system chemotaxis sensor kinase CheA
VLDQLRQGAITLNDELMNGLFRSVDRLKVAVERLRAGHMEDLDPTDVGLPAVMSFSTESPPAEPSAVPPPLATNFDAPTTPPSDEAVVVTVNFPDECDEAPIRAFLIHNKLSESGQVLSTEPNLDQVAGDTVIKTVKYSVRSEASPATLKSFVAAYGVESVSVTEPQQKEPASLSPKTDASQREVHAASPVAEKPAPAAPKRAPATPPPPTANKGDGQPVKAGETLRVDQERLDQLMNLGGELVINRARFVQIHGKFREVFDGKNLGYLVDDMSERMKALDMHLDPTAGNPRSTRDGDEMRDNLLHLSQSFNTVRSLVQRVHELRASMFDFDEALHSLTRVTDGIQKGIMGTRMVPVGPLFTRFRRVVRDIAKTNGKQVELVLHGENTELDKRMIDELGDPLTHMVRNSVDHGLELPEVREAAGKNPAGTVTLEASHRGNSICIEVKDDGAGINLERVRKKIVEREMASAAQVEKMGDRELISYVLKPGFSTAPAVTDLSGRGMGMDIVISKIEKLSGTLEINSVEGQGTHVTIKLPLTLAILKSLVAKIGDGVYAIPLETVAEIITIKQSDIHSIHRRRVVRLREQIIPVVRFEDVFQTDMPGLRTACREQEEQTLVIVGFERERLGLVVDSLKGQEDVVIKSIAENFRNVRGIAGASIRGDGTVSLILDVGALMELAAKSAAECAQHEPARPGAESYA